MPYGARNYVIMGRVAVFVLVSVWSIIMFIMTAFYWALNEQNAKQDPPTPPKKRRNKVPVYTSGNKKPEFWLD